MEMGICYDGPTILLDLHVSFDGAKGGLPGCVSIVSSIKRKSVIPVSFCRAMVSPRPALPFVRLFPSNTQSITESKSNPYPSYHLPSSFHLLIHRADRECRVFSWDLVTLHPSVSLPVGLPFLETIVVLRAPLPTPQ